ncbi:hypothetical protein THRCLA_01627 [Thraustotheca clavata]|uniref:Secreted protein n=1 Tax=Thraustotheca clavata TaxID=74557 RepID=A0A0A7CM07_9STRA|nr:secreted protein [Thraustotheca clavata]OQS06338.1 hypothetical protein THRCLA_01627 [Thraustotheca clavata]
MFWKILFVCFAWIVFTWKEPKDTIVPSIVWNDTSLSMLQLKRVPAFLVAAPTNTQWNTSHWTLDHVLKNLPKRVVVKHSITSTFRHYDPTLELANVFPSKESTLKVHRRQLHSLITQTKNGSYYLNDELVKLSTQLAKDINPIYNFVAPGMENSAMVKLWLGGPSGVVNLHYDATHNVFHQIHGAKRFLLFPPEAYEGLYLYSRLHPSHRQSQLDLSQSVSELIKHFPRFSTAADMMIDVTLNPGDTMYLPPFWFHCVLTSSPSISVNVWSDAEELKFLNQAMSNPLPYLEALEEIGAIYDLNSHLAHLQLFLKLILSRLVEKPLSLAQKILENQAKYMPTTAVRCGEFQTKKAAMDATLTLKPFVDEFVAISFGQMQIQSSREILLMSYLEALMGNYMTAGQIGPFLRHCVVP